MKSNSTRFDWFSTHSQVAVGWLADGWRIAEAHIRDLAAEAFRHKTHPNSLQGSSILRGFGVWDPIVFAPHLRGTQKCVSERNPGVGGSLVRGNLINPGHGTRFQKRIHVRFKQADGKGWERSRFMRIFPHRKLFHGETCER